MDLRFDLPDFRGPLDLLLYLVRREEVDLRDIPIARITEQFQEYLGVIRLLDMDGAGEFLVMAATLLEIKAKLLLPRSDTAAATQEDPRRELVRQLLEYKKYRDAAAVLEAQGEQQQARVGRQPVEMPATAAMPLRRVELWDLVSAFGRLLRETSALQARQILVDETPVHIHMQAILELVQSRGQVSLAELFTPPRTRGRLLGLFLAVLELVKAGRVKVEQLESFGNVVLAPAETRGGPEVGGAA